MELNAATTHWVFFKVQSHINDPFYISKVYEHISLIVFFVVVYWQTCQTITCLVVATALAKGHWKMWVNGPQEFDKNNNLTICFGRVVNAFMHTQSRHDLWKRHDEQACCFSIGTAPGRRQAIIWNNAGIMLIGPLGIHFSEILIEIKTFPFKKMRLKVSSAKRRPFCLGLNVLAS